MNHLMATSVLLAWIAAVALVGATLLIAARIAFRMARRQLPSNRDQRERFVVPAVRPVTLSSGYPVSDRYE
jgi:hypothetical protein